MTFRTLIARFYIDAIVWCLGVRNVEVVRAIFTFFEANLSLFFVICPFIKLFFYFFIFTTLVLPSVMKTFIFI